MSSFFYNAIGILSFLKRLFVPGICFTKNTTLMITFVKSSYMIVRPSKTMRISSLQKKDSLVCSTTVCFRV